MSDLSKVLGDLYATPDPDGPPVREELAADKRVGTRADADLQDALSAALRSAPPGDSGEPPAVAAADQWAEKLERHDLEHRVDLRWTRSDDDILPDRSKAKRRRKR